MPERVTMYSRRRCGLCDEARAVIEEARGTLGFGFREIFVDGDDSLEARYGLRVPVVLIDEQERFEVEVDPDELRGALSVA